MHEFDQATAVTPIRSAEGASIEIQAEVPPSSERESRSRTMLVISLAFAAFLVLVAFGLVPGFSNPQGAFDEYLYLGLAALVAFSGVIGWIRIGRIIRNRAVRIALTPSEIQLSLRDESTFTVRWSDPLIRVEVDQFSLDPASALVLRVRRGKRRVTGAILQSGLTEIQRAADRSGLVTDKRVLGQNPRTWNIWLFYPKSQSKAKAD